MAAAVLTRGRRGGAGRPSTMPTPSSSTRRRRGCSAGRSGRATRSRRVARDGLFEWFSNDAEFRPTEDDSTDRSIEVEVVAVVRDEFDVADSGFPGMHFPGRVRPRPRRRDRPPRTVRPDPRRSDAHRRRAPARSSRSSGRSGWTSRSASARRSRRRRHAERRGRGDHRCASPPPSPPPPGCSSSPRRWAGSSRPLSARTGVRAALGMTRRQAGERQMARRGTGRGRRRGCRADRRLGAQRNVAPRPRQEGRPQSRGCGSRARPVAHRHGGYRHRRPRPRRRHRCNRTAAPSHPAVDSSGAVWTSARAPGTHPRSVVRDRSDRERAVASRHVGSGRDGRPRHRRRARRGHPRRLPRRNLLSSPRLYGAPAALRYESNGTVGVAAVVDRPRATPGVAAVTRQLMINDDTMPAFGTRQAEVEPEALEVLLGGARAAGARRSSPTGPDEVALGAATAEDLGVDVGDSVRITPLDASAPLTLQVSGNGGVGGVRRSGARLHRLRTNVADPGVSQAVDLGPLQRQRRRVRRRDRGCGWRRCQGSAGRCRVPGDGCSGERQPSPRGRRRTRVCSPPSCVSSPRPGLLHQLTTTLRRRRTDLAVVRALGLPARRAAAALVWQALLIVCRRRRRRHRGRCGCRSVGVADRRRRARCRDGHAPAGSGRIRSPPPSAPLMALVVSIGPRMVGGAAAVGRDVEGRVMRAAALWAWSDRPAPALVVARPRRTCRLTRRLLPRPRRRRPAGGILDRPLRRIDRSGRRRRVHRWRARHRSPRQNRCGSAHRCARPHEHRRDRPIPDGARRVRIRPRRHGRRTGGRPRIADAAVGALSERRRCNRDHGQRAGSAEVRIRGRDAGAAVRTRVVRVVGARPLGDGDDRRDRAHPIRSRRRPIDGIVRHRRAGIPRRRLARARPPGNDPVAPPA